MYTAPNSQSAKTEAWGATLSKVKGSPVLRVSRPANDVSVPEAAQPVAAAIIEAPQPEMFLPSADEITLELMIRWLLRSWMVILFLAILGAIGGIAFGMLAKPKFTVTAEMLVDPADLKVMADDVFIQNNQRDAQLFDVESKLTILTSGNVLTSVVDSLKLTNDPEFIGTMTGTLEEKRLEALRAIGKHVAARREEKSFVVSLDVWSQSAPKAVTIANAVVGAFQDELVRAQAEGAGRAAKELFGRLDTLKAEVARADEAVQRFRRENNLQSSSGELVSTLISNQVNTQLIDAQTRVIKARSRYEKLSTGSLESRLDSASIQSQTMTALRTQYALASKELDAQSAILGNRHPKIVALRPELDALRSQIGQEQKRILEASKSELEQAESSLMAQQAQASTIKSTVFEENASLVQLRELEREAQAKSSVYEAFMARAKEIAERQQIDATNVRIISAPTIPKTRSFPPRTLFLTAGGLVAGFGLGCLVALALGYWRLMRRSSEDDAGVYA